MPSIWTPPRTWAKGDVPIADDFNTDIRDNQLFLDTNIGSTGAENFAVAGYNSASELPLLSGGVFVTLPFNYIQQASDYSLRTDTVIRLSNNTFSFPAGIWEILLIVPFYYTNTSRTLTITLNAYTADKRLVLPPAGGIAYTAIMHRIFSLSSAVSGLGFYAASDVYDAPGGNIDDIDSNKQIYIGPSLVVNQPDIPNGFYHRLLIRKI